MGAENSPSPGKMDSVISFDDILRLISDSNISLDDFLKLVYNAAQRSCRVYCRYYNQGDVEDIAQSIVLSLIKDDNRGLRSFNRRSSLKVWLQTIANHEAFHFYRGLYRGQWTAISLEDLSPDEQAYPPSQDDEVFHDEIVRKLTKGQQILLKLMLLGLKTNEIAERNGTNPDSVSRSKSRLRDKIGNLLKSDGGRPNRLAR